MVLVTYVVGSHPVNGLNLDLSEYHHLLILVNAVFKVSHSTLQMYWATGTIGVALDHLLLRVLAENR